MEIIPVILSGGSGLRLWPLSRSEYPKQYLPLIGDRTMLQQTILRLNGLKNLAKPVIVCNSDHRFLVAEQCQQINIEDLTILLEPTGRNTAPAIAAAAIQSLKFSNDSILLVLSADHIIKDIAAFHKAINIAINKALDSKLVVFGIEPNSPNTNYGYIRFSSEENNGSYVVNEFKEKPDLKTAEEYLKKKKYFWNSGMFVFQTTIFLNELKKYSPNIVKAVSNSISASIQDLDFVRLDEESFKLSPSESIDYALMEKSKNVEVVPLNAKWSDIGSWSSLYDTASKDSNKNVIEGDVITQNTFNSYFYAKNHLVAAIGVENLIVVDTPDVTLIAKNDNEQDIKSFLTLLENNNRKEFSRNRKVYRPWGWYDSIEKGMHFQVKRLNISVGAKLSLQMHHKRSEHWVVVKGIAEVVNGDNRLTLYEGDSTYISIGTKHSLENKSNEILEVIEVQSGTYLEEDDIIRFEDIYGRV